MVNEDGAWKQRIQKETKRLYFSNSIFDQYVRHNKKEPSRNKRIIFSDSRPQTQVSETSPHKRDENKRDEKVPTASEPYQNKALNRR